MHFKCSIALLLFLAGAILADESMKQEPPKDAVTVVPTKQELPKDAVTFDPEPISTDDKKKTTTTMKTTSTPTTTPTTPTTPTTTPTTPTTSPTTPTTTPTTPTTTPTTPTIPTTTPSTTIAPTTPPPTVAPTTPTPKSNTTAWVVKDVNGTVCIIAAMVVKIIVPYKTANNKSVNAEFDLLNVENATATGQCGKIEQTLVLTWENITATFNFSHNKENTSYHLSSIEVDIVVNNHTFPNNTMVNASKITLTYDAQVFTVPVNHSYTCANVNPLNMNGTSFNGTTHLNGTFPATLTVSKVHVEAFGITKEDKYSAPMDCSPFETPDIVPIVVGLVLAGLVVVVLIAYLVGRRRAQARGYLSM